MRCWRRSTPSSPKAGRIPPGRMRRPAGPPGGRSGSGGSAAPLSLTGSMVGAISRAVARAEAQGAAAGLAALDSVKDDARLAQYQPFWAARAELLARLGDRAAAAQAYEQAIGLEADPAVRRYLQRRNSGQRP